jgi:type VI secretion system secreted protein VgrG
LKENDMALKQDNRLLNLKTSLGENELVLTSFRGREEISRLFQFQLEMTSDNNAIQAKDIVGTNVTFRVNLADGSPRLFNGFVSRFSAGDEDEKGRRDYRAEVVPWLWFLTRTSDCRIFQDKKVPDIIAQIFGDLGFSDFDDSQIKGTHPKHVYRVQYRETDFNFVSRMMEEEGIFYYFKHEDGKHTLVLADQKGAYTDCVEKEVNYPSLTGSHSLKGQISRWEHRYEFRTGKVAQTDYNFETPSTSLMTNEPSVVKIPGMDKYEFYDYPGMYPTTGDGRPLTRLRMEEEEAGHDIVHGASTCRTFSPGYKFKVGTHRSASEEGKSYVVTSVQHSASEAMPHETGRGGREEEEGYQNTFTCIPDSVTFRPERITRRPFVQGLQTAVVVGPPGEEIYPDKYGRVKIQFFWDREGKKDDKSSCWVRVSQNWAGQEWGGMFIPHVGQEVIVDFLEGDPDRPIITGRVYNAEQIVPLPLPDEKTKCIIRDYGNNQMIWEGKPGEQYLHIQQECGNELLMNGITGKESVQLRDMYGNEIFMDSVGGTMRLSSPSHNSAIILGNSIYQQCDSNNASFTNGDTINVHRGLKHDVYRGFRSQTDVGGYYEAQLGWKSSVVIGSIFAGHLGNSVGLQYAKEVDLNLKDYVHHSAGPIKMDSDKVIGLVGGAGDASKAILAGHSFTMAYKQSDEKGRSSFGPAEVAALVLGLGGHTAMAVQGVQMKAMKDKISAKIEKAKKDGRDNNKPQDEIDKEVAAIAKEWTNTNISNWNGELAAAMGAMFGVAAAKLAKNPSKVDPHKGAEGEIRLHKRGATIAALQRSQSVAMDVNGVLVKSNDAFIRLKAKKEIALISDEAVVYTAPKFDYKVGFISHKNLKVLK